MMSFRLKMLFIAGIIAVSPTGCCSLSQSNPPPPPPPHLLSLNPSSGPPGTLVKIQFTGNVASGSFADIGGSVNTLYFLDNQGGTVYTPIPQAAKQGIVHISIVANSGSNSLSFSVTSDPVPYKENTIDIPATAIFKTTSPTLFYLYSYKSGDVFEFNSQDLTYADLFSSGVYVNGKTVITPDGRYVIGAPYALWTGPNYIVDVYDSLLNSMVTLTYGADVNNFVVSNDSKRLYVYSNDSPDIIREYTMPDFNNITNMIPVPPPYGISSLAGISGDDRMLYVNMSPPGMAGPLQGYLWAISITDPSSAGSFSITDDVNHNINNFFLFSSPYSVNTVEQSPDGTKLYSQGFTYDNATGQYASALALLDITGRTSQYVLLPDYINTKVSVSPGGQYAYAVMDTATGLILAIPLRDPNMPTIAIPYTSNFVSIGDHVPGPLFSQDGSTLYIPLGDKLLMVKTNGYN